MKWVQNNNHYLAYDEGGTYLGRVWAPGKGVWQYHIASDQPHPASTWRHARYLRAHTLKQAKARFTKKLVADAVSRLTAR